MVSGVFFMPGNGSSCWYHYLRRNKQFANRLFVAGDRLRTLFAMLFAESLIRLSRKAVVSKKLDPYRQRGDTDPVYII